MMCGALFRTSRLFLFVLVLWLLTPWWTRRDLLLVRTHLLVLWSIVGSVVVGLLVAPGLALTDDRLGGGDLRVEEAPVPEVPYPTPEQPVVKRLDA